jgi:hypothetical protein
MQGDNLIDPDEWRFLVGGAAPRKTLDRPGKVKRSKNRLRWQKRSASWIADDMWQSILALSELPRFQGIDESFLIADDLLVYKNYFDAGLVKMKSKELGFEWVL